MNKVLVRVVITITLVFLVQTVVSKTNIETNRVADKLSTTQVSKNLASIPLSFTENLGQWDDKVKFRADAGGATMWFGADGAFYQFTRMIESENSKAELTTLELMDTQPISYETIMIKANFMGSNTNTVVVGLEEIDYKCNYFIGNDKSKWATNVPNYTAVMYEEIYNGIDLKYYGNGKQMEYDFIVSPGADFSQIKIQYEGAESVKVNDNGQLVVSTKWGEVVEQRPVIYQVENGNRIAIDGKYLLQDNNSFSFVLSNYDASLELIIDPILEYSTYLGGERDDYGIDLVADSIGNLYIAGHCYSTDFPTTPNAYDTSYQGGHRDLFVTKLSSTGNSLIYSTYIGGTERDESLAMALDSEGAVYLSGFTSSLDFPTLNPVQSTHQGDTYDTFVTKLNSSGDSLIYSTYLGGDGYENGNSLAIDNLGYCYLAGWTSSSNFPTLNSISDTLNGSFDAFVTKLSINGDSLVYSTYFGGSGTDQSESISVDSNGNTYICGATESSDFPTLNPYQATNQGGGDAFVTILNSTGDGLIYSTYLGGTGDEGANGLSLNNQGEVYIIGRTSSTDFPMKNSYQNSHQGGTYDTFVSKLSSTGDSLIYSTYLGGTGSEFGTDIAIDSSGSAYVTGYTSSTDFPVINSYQATNQGSNDVFVTKLSTDGNSLDYSTYLGGTLSDAPRGITLDASGACYITGLTKSTDFPTLNDYQGSLEGFSTFDGFITKFQAVATDIKEFDIDNLPENFNMSQNYPNPFNPSTTIEFNLPTKSNVTVTIYNLLGQKVQQLVNQEYSAGNYRVTWDGTSSNGVQTSSGIYLYRIETENFVETKKMLLLK